MIPADLFYSSPGFASLLFVLPPLVLLLLFLALWRRRIWQRYGAPGLLSMLLSPLSNKSFWLRAFFLCGAWIFAVVALMGPEGEGRYLTPPKKEASVLRMRPHQVLFLLDNSASMGVADESGAATRLERAKEIVEETVKRLRGETVSLYGFTSEPDRFIPETMDSLYFRLRLREIGINEGGAAGTDIAAALKEALRGASKETTVVLLSDGGEEEVALDPEALRLYAVGLGTEEGGEVPEFGVRTSLNERPLRELANRGGGKYYSSERLSVLEIAEDLSREIRRKSAVVAERGEEGEERLVYKAYYYYPLGLAILSLLSALFIQGRGRRLFLLLALFLPLSSFASEREQMLRAKNFLQAGEPEKGRGIYANLLLTKPVGWKRAILEYNIATAYLVEGEPERAAALLEQVPLGRPPFPPLQRAVKRNLAAARFQLGLRKAKEGDERAALYFFRRALEDSEVSKLREQAQLHLAHLLYRHTKKQFAEAGLQEGVPLLIAAVRGIEGDLKQLSGNEQLKRIQDEAESWLPFWEKMAKEAKEPLFDEAFEQFRGGLEWIEAGSEEALHLLHQSSEALALFFRRMIGGDPLRQTLEQLLHDYDEAAGYSPLQEARLQSLIEEQEQIAAETALSLPMEELKRSYRAAARGMERRARFRFAVARQQVRRLLWELAEGPGTAKSVLERGIEEAAYALILARYVEKEGEQRLEAAKQKTLETVASFVRIALKEQEEGFKERCQYRPWSEALPLFEKGERTAKRASAGGIPYQEQTLLYWREALAKLKRPYEEGGCEKEQRPRKEMEQILRLLQQMEKDDRMPKEKRGMIREGERPW